MVLDSGQVLGIAGNKVINSHNIVSGSEEFFTKVAPNKTGTTGNQNTHIQVHKSATTIA